MSNPLFLPKSPENFNELAFSQFSQFSQLSQLHSFFSFNSLYGIHLWRRRQNFLKFLRTRLTDQLQWIIHNSRPVVLVIPVSYTHLIRIHSNNILAAVIPLSTVRIEFQCLFLSFPVGGIFPVTMRAFYDRDFILRVIPLYACSRPSKEFIANALRVDESESFSVYIICCRITFNCAAFSAIPVCRYSSSGKVVINGVLRFLPLGI